MHYSLMEKMRLPFIDSDLLCRGDLLKQVCLETDYQGFEITMFDCIRNENTKQNKH